MKKQAEHNYMLHALENKSKLCPSLKHELWLSLIHIFSSDNPQGLFISGYFAEEEKRFAVPYNMVLASNVDELNFLASRLETLSAGELSLIHI